MHRLGRSVALGLLLGTAAAPHGALAQQRLKVYVTVDMEGVAGVVAPEQVGGKDYEWGRSLLLAETNAAIGAAFEAGATEVVVNDAHGSHTNLRADLLDPRATLISGRPKPLGMVQGIDSTFDAAVFIGFHGHANQIAAVMGHTYSGAMRHVRLNGREVGEYGTAAMVAGHFGVPVVFASGDQAFAEAARAFMPGIEALAVKEGLGFSAARTMSPEAARKAIAAGVKTGLGKRKSVAPVRIERPVHLEVELASAAYADKAMFVPGMERVDGLTVRYLAPDGVAAYRMSRLIMMLARD